jgi:hypothetical protein
MMASVAGSSSAAPTPWMARLAMSTPPLPASPAARLPPDCHTPPVRHQAPI